MTKKSKIEFKKEFVNALENVKYNNSRWNESRLETLKECAALFSPIQNGMKTLCAEIAEIEFYFQNSNKEMVEKLINI